jgi:Cys-Gly metallodipeptidase DUG1
MGEWLITELTRLGFTEIEKRDPGMQTLEGKEIPLPPIVLGSYGKDKSKKTVLVYGHVSYPDVLAIFRIDMPVFYGLCAEAYIVGLFVVLSCFLLLQYDVQPALKSDGWRTDPFTLVEDEQGRLFGRGSTDDKAPIISWLWVVEAYQKLGLEMPVNLKVCFEGMEESGSEGLDELIIKEAKGYFADVDCVCISDNCECSLIFFSNIRDTLLKGRFTPFHLLDWLGTNKPCLTYGLRGVSYFFLEVEGPAKDLHSGVFGGTVHEPMTDLIYLMHSLVDPKGKILIPGIYDDVAPVTEEEESRYKNLDFNLGDIHAATESQTTIHSSVRDTLMHRWRFPSLSLHGIEGAFYAPGAKTVIPAKVIGKFSIRSVPDQEPERIAKIVTEHVENEFKKLGSKNVIKVVTGHGGKAWVADVNHWNFGK